MVSDPRNLTFDPAANGFEFSWGPNIHIVHDPPIPQDIDCYSIVVYTEPEGGLPPDHTEGPHLYTLYINKEFLDTLARQAGIHGVLNFPKGYVSSELQYLGMTLFNEAKYCPEGHNLMTHALEIQIAVTVLRFTPPGALADKRNINRAIDYIIQNYREQFSLARLAQMANYSSYHFIRVFKGQTGKTPFDYLTDIRVERAAKLLLQSDASITDICFSCGFTSPSHFTTLFKRKMGVTPSNFKC